MDFFGFNLGRQVATPEQVFSVVRPELRVAMTYGTAIMDACRAGRLHANPDFELLDGGDKAVDSVIWEALVGSATNSVKQWAADEGVVYDREKMGGFLEHLLREAWSNRIEWDAIDY